MFHTDQFVSILSGESLQLKVITCGISSFVIISMYVPVFLRRSKIQWIIWLNEFLFDVNIGRCQLSHLKNVEITACYCYWELSWPTYSYLSYTKKKRITAIWDLFKRSDHERKNGRFGAWLSPIRNLFFCIRSSCDCVHR